MPFRPKSGDFGYECRRNQPPVLSIRAADRDCQSAAAVGVFQFANGYPAVGIGGDRTALGGAGLAAGPGHRSGLPPKLFLRPDLEALQAPWRQIERAFVMGGDGDGKLVWPVAKILPPARMR